MRVLALAILIALAGCVSPPAAKVDDAAVALGSHGPAPVAEPRLANLSVLALFADRTPLAGVNVTIANVSRMTDATGLAQFNAVPSGEHTLVATKIAHRTTQALVRIESGKDNTAEVVLAAEAGGQHSHQVGFTAHRDVYAFEGSFDCSATYVIITGDCLILVENVTHTAGAPDPLSNTTTERNVIDFALDLHWSSLIVEMTWSEPSPSTTEGMTLALEPAEAPTDGHAAKYARVDGMSPLRLDLVPGVQHASATEKDMPNPAGGEVIRARAFARGYGHHPGGTDLLGVGVAKDMRFTLHVSVFYGEPAPEGYTALA